MDNKHFTEVKRQLFHMLSGVVLIILIAFDILDIRKIAVLIFIGFILSIISRKYKVWGLSWLLKHFEREKDIKAFPGRGAFFYLLGVFFSLLLFSKDTALAAIMIMALGDSVATLFRVQHKIKLKHPFSSKKYLETALIGGLAGFFGAMLFVNPIYAFISSIIAMLVEGIDIKFGFTEVDDNLVIPIVAGLVITLLKLIFG